MLAFAGQNTAVRCKNSDVIVINEQYYDARIKTSSLAPLHVFNV